MAVLVDTTVVNVLPPHVAGSLSASAVPTQRFRMSV